MTPEQRRVLAALREKPEYSCGAAEHRELLKQGLVRAQWNELNCVTWTITAQGRRALAEAEGEEECSVKK